MSAKRSLLLVLAVLSAAAGILGGMVALHFTKGAQLNEKRFTDALCALEAAAQAEPFVPQDFTAALQDQVCTGDWAKTERAAKACLRDVYNCFCEMQAVCAFYDFARLASAENMLQDGPEFQKLFAQLDTAEARAGDILRRTETLLRPETVRSYLAGTDVRASCETLFETAFAQRMDAKSDGILADMRRRYDRFMQQAGACREILTYYRDHQSDWFVERGSLFWRGDSGQEAGRALRSASQILYGGPA